jgi:hypothetical protein
MTKVILDQATLPKFQNVKDRAEICDEAGRTVGYFIPVADRSLYQTVKVPFTEEELDRFEQEPGGRSLAEILADLEKRS